MSGPKVSQAELERRRKEEIERQRREALERERRRRVEEERRRREEEKRRRREEEERRRREEEERRRREEEERRRKEEEARKKRVAIAKNTINEQYNHINSIIKNYNDIVKKTYNAIQTNEIDIPSELVSLEQTIKSCSNNNTRLLDEMNTENESVLANIINQQQNTIKKLKSLNCKQAVISKEIERLKINKELADEINNLSKQIAEQHKKQLEIQAKQKIEEEKRRIEEEKIRLENEIKAKEQEEQAKLVILETINTSINEVYQESYICDEIRTEVEKLIEKFNAISKLDIQYIKDFNNIELSPALKNLSKKIENRKNFIDKFNDKYTEYFVLCESLNIEPKKFSLDKESFYYIESEIVRLDELAQKQAEDNYVKEAITEVMNEMGYQIIGDAKDTVDDYLSNAIYQFDENTAIALTLDTNGNISMEIGSLDDCDREPDAKEAVQLKADMDRFCSKHKEFKERLTKKGVNLTIVHELPPSTEYAQVFNLNDYDVSEVDKLHILNARNSSEIAQRNNSISLNVD